ncbi:hypothetical protein THOM_2463 [Trachipleistophora hominis]|uniref:Uncharacterized protein n=1 Tax=Trachipleistophora hominis TaxID=72359 RepID=L7JT96_TRAHO|nr:hypothetical protein THOM_2463 [Trachipleistophora hominis]
MVHKSERAIVVLQPTKKKIINKRVLEERKTEKERQEKQLRKKGEEIVADKMRQERRTIHWKKGTGEKNRSLAESATKKDIINGDARKIGEKIKGILNIYIRSIKKNI